MRDRILDALAVVGVSLGLGLLLLGVPLATLVFLAIEGLAMGSNGP